MRLADLVFVTSNPGKRREAEAILGVALRHQPLELEEIQSLDLEAVVRAKARAAHAALGEPVLVEDTALELMGLGGFPGPLVRFLLGSVGPGGISRLARCFEDDRARARCLAVAFDGHRPVIGAGEVAGRIVPAPRGAGGFGWDSVFAPDHGNGRTYAEMDDAEKNRISHRRLAFRALADGLR